MSCSSSDLGPHDRLFLLDGYCFIAASKLSDDSRLLCDNGFFHLIHRARRSLGCSPSRGAAKRHSASDRDRLLPSTDRAAGLGCLVSIEVDAVHSENLSDCFVLLVQQPDSGQNRHMARRPCRHPHFRHHPLECLDLVLSRCQAATDAVCSYGLDDGRCLAVCAAPRLRHAAQRRDPGDGRRVQLPPSPDPRQRRANGTQSDRCSLGGRDKGARGLDDGRRIEHGSQRRVESGTDEHVGTGLFETDCGTEFNYLVAGCANGLDSGTECG